MFSSQKNADIGGVGGKRVVARHSDHDRALVPQVRFDRQRHRRIGKTGGEFCEGIARAGADDEKIKKLLGAKRFNVRQRMQNVAAADCTQLRAECFCFAESGIGLVTGG